MLGYKTISKLSLAFVINSNLLDKGEQEQQYVYNGSTTGLY